MTFERCGAAAAAIAAMPPGVHVRTLPNGLTIVVREDASAAVVAAQAWCRAGSIDEGQWLGAGLSHVLEHMLFKGTTTRGPGRIDQEVQEAGGSMNAFTSFDRTVYWINVPSTGAAVAVDILCDIMRHASLPADELAKEMEVIRREMDMGRDDPGRWASQRLFETAYTRSPYRYTVIGYPDVFDRLTREDVVAYYREKYAPNNLFFVVVGDVKREEVFAQIQKAMSDARSRPLPALELMEEPRQMAPRETVEEAAIELGHVHLGWHIPELRHPDVPHLDVLATLLGGGRSSRLYREVRQKRALVTAVEAWVYSPGRPGLMGVSATVEGDKYAAARDAILEGVEQIRTEGPSAAEVAKAVKQFIAGFLATRKTMQGQAQDLGGSWMAAGDLNFSERYLAAVRQTTPEQLRRVAQQYLTPENRTVYALLPSGRAETAPVVITRAAERPIRATTLANGLRLLVKEDHRLPFVEMRLVLQGGVLAEPPAQSGITHSMVRMLMQGTTRRSAEELAEAIESVGGQLDTYSGNNSFGVTAEVLSEDVRLGLELLADALLNPAFPPDAFERERQAQLAAVRAQRDQMLQSAFRMMRRSLFGEQGYGLDALGSEDTVANLSREQAMTFHRQLTTPGNAVFAVYGDVVEAEVERLVGEILGGWSGNAGRALEGRQGGFAGGGARRHVEACREKKQAVLAVGYPGAALADSDRFALELLQEACSDLGSRLFLRVRERLGLAYYVGAQNMLGLVPGYFAFYAGTAPEHAGAVERELCAEAGLLVREGLSGEELARVKAKTLGQRKIARQDLGMYALVTALDELYGLGYDHVDREDARYEAVTGEDVRAAAVRYLVPDREVVALVQPGENDVLAAGAGEGSMGMCRRSYGSWAW